jgi:hypothetical protein
VVRVLATGPTGHVFKPGRGDGFLIATKLISTPSFGGEVKPEDTCHKILRHVKEPCVAWLRCYVIKIQGNFLPPHWISGAAREHWWINQGYKNADGDTQDVRKWRQCLGRFVWHHPATVTSTFYSRVLKSIACEALLHKAGDEIIFTICSSNSSNSSEQRK